MRSIGFDTPDSPMTGAALELAGMLAGLQHELADRGMSGRELLAVTFDLHRGNIELVIRPQPLGADYPDLATLLAQIARTCVQHGIAFSQFRRIVFAERQLRFELVDVRGMPQVYLYSLVAEKVP